MRSPETLNTFNINPTFNLNFKIILIEINIQANYYKCGPVFYEYVLYMLSYAYYIII